MCLQLSTPNNRQSVFLLTYNSPQQQKQIHKFYFIWNLANIKQNKKIVAAGNSDGGEDKLNLDSKAKVQFIQATAENISTTKVINVTPCTVKFS